MAESRLEERIRDSKIRWYFTKEEVQNSPSRANGVEQTKELSYRQQAANMIEDMGQRLNVNQLCINTAIVYMHRFYMVHSFKTFHRMHVATGALFLAAKVEEQPRKLEYVAKVSFSCQNRDAPMLDTQSETYTKLIEEITYHELLILETLGFEVAVEHPHPHVVNCMHLVRASKDLSQTAYFMAHNSLLLTTFCLQHRPTIVACVCIHLACRWKGLEIPLSADNKNWWEYIDPDVTLDQLNVLTKEFLMIYEKCPSRLQKKITEPMRVAQQQGKSDQPSSSGSSSHAPNKGKSSSHKHKVSSQPPPQPSSSGQKHHHSQQQQSAHKVHHHAKHSSKPQESHPKSHIKQLSVAKSQSPSVKAEHGHLRPPQISNTDRSESMSPRPQFAKLPSKSQGGGWKQTEHHPLHGHSSKTPGTTEQRRQRQTDLNHDTHRHHREDHRKRPHGGDVPETKRTKLDPPLPPPLPPSVDCSMPPLPPLPASPPPPPPPATTSHHHVPPFLPRGSNVTLPPLPLAFPWGSPPQPL